MDSADYKIMSKYKKGSQGKYNNIKFKKLKFVIKYQNNFSKIKLDYLRPEITQ